MDLIRVSYEDTPGNQIEYVHKIGKIYNTIFIFKEDALTEKRMADLFKRKVICKKKECSKYELLTEECLEIHKLVYHGDQQFEDGHRPIKHGCKKENKNLKRRTLIE